MENILRVVRDAVATLEEYLPDVADCADTDAEKKKVRDLLNRISKVTITALKEL